MDTRLIYRYEVFVARLFIRCGSPPFHKMKGNPTSTESLCKDVVSKFFRFITGLDDQRFDGMVLVQSPGRPEEPFGSFRERGVTGVVSSR